MEALKIGDWITVSGPTGRFIEKISAINSETYTLSGTNICYKSQATKWTPEPGEWVIPDSGINDDMFVVMRYNGVSLIPSRCQPFIGELPSNLKEL